MTSTQRTSHTNVYTPASNFIEKAERAICKAERQLNPVLQAHYMRRAGDLFAHAARQSTRGF